MITVDDERLRGFSDGPYYATLSLYCACAEIADAAERERVRMSVKHGAELAAHVRELPRRTLSSDERFAILCRGLRLCAEQNLQARAVILSERGDGDFERALAITREIVRPLADDVNAMQCGHDGEPVRELCVHLLATKGPHHRRFTGKGGDYVLVCEACVQAASLRKLCADCFLDYVGGERLPDLGAPQILERRTPLRFERTSLTSAPPDVIAVAPGPRGVWWMLDRGGRLHRVGAACEAGVVIAGIDLSEVDLYVHGAIAAVCERKGTNAVIVDAASGRVTKRIQRGDYHIAHCRFPFAFVELDERVLAIFAVAWNQLEACDATTGAPVPRPVTKALDYFHAGLVPSPNGARLVDNGWHWGPFGVVNVIDTRVWLAGADAMITLCARDYYWDGPVAWIDEHTVAVWGAGDDDLLLTPAARIFDVRTGEELRVVHGPAAGLFFAAPYLVDGAGAIWDPVTGERLARDAMCKPLVVHPVSGDLLCRDGEGWSVARISA